jgi:universal stress protein E
MHAQQSPERSIHRRRFAQIAASSALSNRPESSMSDIRHMLVATDLTDRSTPALRRGLQLCRDAHVPRLTLLHVIVAGLPQELADAQRSGAQAFLDRQLLEGGSPKTNATAAVCTGDPFSTIISEGVTRAADLLVIGQPAVRRYSEFFTGTTAERVIRFADRPVLMVKQAPQGRYRRVLIAFDGSDGSVRALRTALAVAPDAEFRVVHAWWKPRVALGEVEAANQAIADENKELQALVRKAVDKAVRGAPTGALTLNIDLIEDNPYTALSSQRSWADLVVMGTHSRGRLARTVSIGRLAQHLLVETPCDVLTARP